MVRNDLIVLQEFPGKKTQMKPRCFSPGWAVHQGKQECEETNVQSRKRKLSEQEAAVITWPPVWENNKGRKLSAVKCKWSNFKIKQEITGTSFDFVISVGKRARLCWRCWCLHPLQRCGVGLQTGPPQSQRTVAGTIFPDFFCSNCVSSHWSRPSPLFIALVQFGVMAGGSGCCPRRFGGLQGEEVFCRMSEDKTI